MTQSRILQFYDNQNVFITGATGFLGKVLVEKLLRSTNVATLYILIRNKKGVDKMTRLEKIFNCALFDRLKSERPDYKKLVVPIEGDCVKENLDLSVEDQEELMSKINIVFHGAASVNFNENIKIAFDINVNGTKHLLNLCKKFQDLKAVVHVSTAYVYWHLDTIDEVFYEHPLHYQQAESILQKLSPEEAVRMTPSILREWTTTYTFTKALAESLVKETADGLPIGICRVGAVIPSYNEPIENWMDSAASLGVLLVVSLGIIRVVASEEGPKAEFVPVDLVASALIACAWDIPYQDPIPIYNYISSTDNPTSVHDFFHSFKTQISRYPLSKAMWTPRLTIATSQIWHTILKVLYHYIPSLLVDLLSVITLKKPQMFVKSRKYERAIDLSYSFVNKYRTFSNRNVKNLCDKMNDSDRELFPCDVRLINWDRQHNGFQKGARIYLFNDPLSTLPEAKAKMHKFDIAHRILLFTTYSILATSLWILLSSFN